MLSLVAVYVHTSNSEETRSLKTRVITQGPPDYKYILLNLMYITVGNQFTKLGRALKYYSLTQYLWGRFSVILNTLLIRHILMSVFTQC